MSHVAGRNALILSGTLLSSEPIRLTPAGVPVTEGVLMHEAQVKENGLGRTLQFEMPFLAMGDVALRLVEESPGTRLEASGFIAPKTLKIAKLVMHITDYIKGA